MKLPLDAAIVAGCALVVLAAVAVRGVNGLGPCLAAVLLIDAGYVALAVWRRR